MPHQEDILMSFLELNIHRSSSMDIDLNFQSGRLKDYFNLVYHKIFRNLNPHYGFIKNYYRTNYSKKVLVSYTYLPFVLPFRGNQFYSHSNQVESLHIAQIFHQLGFQVDLAAYDHKIRINKKRHYDLIFGHEPNLSRFSQYSPHAKIIHYATGAYHTFRNRNEQLRINRLLKRKKLTSSKIKTQWGWLDSPDTSFDKSDAIFLIGNTYTKNTYPKKYHSKIIPLTTIAHSFYPRPLIQTQKDFDKAKKNFLCLISSAPIHKGLDLLLDVFEKNPNLHLYIAGNIFTDPQFVKIYRHQLFHLPNIHYQGWVSINSHLFKTLVSRCAFITLVSASEGINGAVPTCMHSGLIPIITHTCGVDIKKSGLILSDDKLSTIQSALKKYSSLSNQKLESLSSRSQLTALSQYTQDQFRSQFIDALASVLS